MSSVSLPPGFRFRPTDDELVGYYLKRKVDGLCIELEIIPVIELYKYDPWDLPDKSLLPKRDLEWFFFCPRDRKYPNGTRTNRATGSGYWKATGKDRKIACEPSVYGVRKTLVFYRGRAPGGERTGWAMHEYRLCEDPYQGSTNFLGAFALCRVVKKIDHGLKAGDPHAESRAKRCSSSAAESGYRGYIDNVLSVSEENSAVVTKLSAKSEDSTPRTSPDTGREVELQPIMKGFWESQMVAIASKTSPDEGISNSVITFGNTNVTESSPPRNLPNSYVVNLMEEDFMVDELSWSGNLPSFPSPTSCMGFYDNAENFRFHSLELDGPKHLNASYSGTETWNPVVPASLCKQASEGEDLSLWLQEDILVK
ncbi:unnamed protein product [Musa textilis]